jgi:hypothetical protein
VLLDRKNSQREELGRFLRQHRTAILKAWTARMADCPHLKAAKQLTQRSDHLRVLSVLLKLFIRHLLNADDDRCFDYAQRLAAEQFMQGVTASEAVQIIVLLKRTLFAVLLEKFSDHHEACALMNAMDEDLDALQLAMTETYHHTRETELRRHTQRWEQRIEASVEKLRESESRYRDLLQAEQQSAGQLAMMHEVGSRALTANTLQEFLDAAAAAIQKNFQYYDVLLFIVDHNAAEVVLAAHFGGYYNDLPKGYRQRFGVGMVGWAAAHGETLLANDVSQEARHILAFPEEEKSCSELAVPIKLGETVLGVIDVQSQQLNAFDQRDMSALQTLADQMATAIENIFLYQEMRDLKEFNESVIASIPAALMVVDADLKIVSVNQIFCEEVQQPQSQVMGSSIHDVFDLGMLCEVGLAEQIEATLATGEPHELMGTRRATQERPDRIFDIRITPLAAENQNRALVVMTDMTRRLREAAQLQLLYQMSRFLLRESLDFDQLLYTVLTCITAGPALGFNRAFLLLLDEKKQTLQGAMALGPSDPHEANLIWNEITYHKMSLEDLIEAYEQFSQQEESPLQSIVKKIRIPLDGDAWPAVTKAVRDKQAFPVKNARSQPNTGYPFPELTPPEEFAVAPLISSDGVIGVVIADNIYNNQPIDDEDVQLLETLAHQAGLAIANAQAFNQLQHTQQQLVHAEKMAAIGEMAARVSHEIRNPLSTVGGFARSILRRPDDRERIKRNTQIIAEEVKRLEDLLTDMLDLARPPKLMLRPENLHDILDQAWLLSSGEVRGEAPVAVRKDYASHLPPVYVDARSLLRAFLNVVRNGVQAMPEGGTLTIATRMNGNQVQVVIADTGTGIPRHVLPTIFTPFVSHRTRGSGLGLPITRQVIEEHGGRMEAESEEGKGSRFTFYLPVKPPEPHT